jgi:delta 1-pyrroline-5-carboxylate dehydrogenase
VADVLTSAFDSAGQRCSALRLMYVQSDIAERLIAMLAGAMRELAIGDPLSIATDVGPVIDAEARRSLQLHAERMGREGRLVFECKLPSGAEYGNFFAPRAFEIDSAHRLEREVFGPILHLVRWPSDRLDAAIDEIAATGYGLTLGIQSRIDDMVAHIRGRQCVRQPEHDRRRGRRSAVRRRTALRHRAEGGGAALPAPFCHRAHRIDRPHGGRRQCDIVVAGRNGNLIASPSVA